VAYTPYWHRHDYLKANGLEHLIMFTAKQKREAIERELGYRRRVYDQRVADGKMTKELADFQIKIFEAIRDDYGEIEKRERLI
jgi:hypothetical protein